MLIPDSLYLRPFRQLQGRWKLFLNWASIVFGSISTACRGDAFPTPADISEPQEEGVSVLGALTAVWGEFSHHPIPPPTNAVDACGLRTPAWVACGRDALSLLPAFPRSIRPCCSSQSQGSGWVSSGVGLSTQLYRGPE